MAGGAFSACAPPKTWRTPPSAPVTRTPAPVADAVAPVEIRPVAVKEVAVRVSAPDARPVDVHVADRGGEIRVSVRAVDTDMRASLRQDLPSLVSRLEDTGMRTEAFVPGDTHLTRIGRVRHTSLDPIVAVPADPDRSFADYGSSDSRPRDPQQDLSDRGRQQRDSQDSRHQQRRQNQHQQRHWLFAMEDLA